MSDVQSPYSGRPVDEWLDREVELHDTDGDEIGNVLEVNPDFLVVETDGGFLGLGARRMYYIPRDEVRQADDDDWILNRDKDDLELMGWSVPPSRSAWASDWDAVAGPFVQRGATRIRRYEEELVADTVERQAGEVVVNKDVVEETRTIDVPVRREEVHIERRPITDEAAQGDATFQRESVRVPVMEEDVEVRKVARPVEELEITKTQTQDTRHVESTVRREEFDVDDRIRRDRGATGEDGA